MPLGREERNRWPKGRPQPTALWADVCDLLLRHGHHALDAMDRLDPEHSALLGRLVEHGLIDKAGGRHLLSSHSLIALQRQVLWELMARLGGRPAGRRAASIHQPIDPAAVTAALRKALLLHIAACPVRPDEEEVDRRLAEELADASVAIVIDVSDAMGRFDRLAQAKKVALAIGGLVRERFGGDTIDVIAFDTVARRVAEHEVPLLAPRSPPQARPSSARAPLSRGHELPPHFANLDMGLRLAAQTLAGHASQLKLALAIVGGDITAHLDGQDVVAAWPPDPATAIATIAQARTLAQAGISLTVFALIDDHDQIDWIGHVDRLTHASRGAIYYCSSDDLPLSALEAYLVGKSQRSRAT